MSLKPNENKKAKLKVEIDIEPYEIKKAISMLLNDGVSIERISREVVERKIVQTIQDNGTEGIWNFETCRNGLKSEFSFNNPIVGGLFRKLFPDFLDNSGFRFEADSETESVTLYTQDGEVILSSVWEDGAALPGVLIKTIVNSPMDGIYLTPEQVQMLFQKFSENAENGTASFKVTYTEFRK